MEARNENDEIPENLLRNNPVHLKLREETETRFRRLIRHYETEFESHIVGFIGNVAKMIEPVHLKLKEETEAAIEEITNLANHIRNNETRIIRPIRSYETRIERPLRPYPVHLKLKEETMRPSELLKEMYYLNQRKRAFLNADTSEVKMIFGKQKVHISNRRSCHGTKLLKSSLSLTSVFVPCAGGIGHGSSQPEHQGHSEIYPSTLNVVSNCPSRGEYMQTSLTKCAEVCGSYMQDGKCAYHCMRDSSKTKLVEFCAKPKPFFEYCPEYDPVDQTIQKDLATLCNSTFSRNYYNSSDIYFCDPNNCLQLHESSVRGSATTLTTLMNETTEMNGGDSQGWFFLRFVALAALILAAILIGCILLRRFVKSGIFSEMRKKINQNGKQYVYTGRRIPDYM